ncbi:MAG: hypothetical protein ACOCWW_00580, partial [Bacteroidota bacterium]
NSLAKGWENALANPEYAIKLLEKYDDDVDAERELASLKRGSEYFSGQNGKILYVDDKAWIKLNNDLKLLNKIDSSFDIKDSYDNSFVNKYHNEK